ncbi:MAG TPA: sugar ABC transporter permease [Candidatus Pullilachnospira intestinigallinarum]|nr:sugar ABC transporter permease [Candidatus Pullilachnospira intestinigallinarum]
MRKRNPLHKWPYIFVAPFVITYLLFYLYPMLFSFGISLTDWTAVDMDTRNFVGIKNYIRVFTDDPMFWKSVLNTIKIMLIAMPLTIIAGLLMAVLMFNIIKCRQFIQTVNFLPYITMPVAIGLIFANIFNMNIGPVNQILEKLGILKEGLNWLGDSRYAFWVVILMCMWKNFGYFMVIYLSGLSTISGEYYDAAKVDGANAVQRFFKITLPLLRPITTFVIVQGAIGGFQLFDEAKNLVSGAGSNIVGGPGRSLLTIVWYFYDTSFQNNSRYGYGAAIAFSMMLIVGLISLINVSLLNRREG